MALKLGKCRLCLKLGDFYSIFATDNTVQLAEMVMDCTRVKIFENDGLPEKICTECVEKLSSSYLFKQQVERSDVELRRNFVPPPGVKITPPSNRESNDSGISNRTEYGAKAPSIADEKPTSSGKPFKRSRNSDSNFSNELRKNHLQEASSSKIDYIKSEKRRKPDLDDDSTQQSDYEDNGNSQFSGETDSDDILIHKCQQCEKQFLSKRSLALHVRIHSKISNNTTEQTPPSSPPTAAPESTTDNDTEDATHCELCNKSFKLKIMLKRHYDVCPKRIPKKELKITLEKVSLDEKIECEICGAQFKAIGNLEKHMRVVHAAVLKMRTSEVAADSAPESVQQPTPVPCVFCHKTFDNFYTHSTHFNTCPVRSNVQTISCLVCRRKFEHKNTYFTHLKETHLAHTPKPSTPRPNTPKLSTPKVNTPKPNLSKKSQETYDCRICNKKFNNQELLVSHLAHHVSYEDDMDSMDADNSRTSPLDDTSFQVERSSSNTPNNLKCQYCDKVFTYKKSLQKHIDKHMSGDIPMTTEDDQAPDSPAPTEDESSQDDDDNTCDICEKQFSYKRVLLHHKRTKHNISSGTKRANFALKDCLVTCLICDISMKVADSNAHNQQHHAAGIKPRNKYTCMQCEDTFKSCQALSTHIKMVHRLNLQVTKKMVVSDLADFCEVVVTKTEPLDSLQSHNESGEQVPLAEGDAEYTCPVCSKKMPTLASLKRHVRWHTNVGNNIEAKYDCFVCKMEFKFKGHYKQHMSQHYKDTTLDPKFLTCTICNRKSKHLRAAQMHMKFHDQTRFNTKDYECSICKRVFQQRKVYLSHMANHQKRGEALPTGLIAVTQENQCPHCGKVCDSASSLKCHMTWHKSKSSLYGARYECGFCEQVFTNKKTRDLHVRTHYEDDDGAYKCSVCNKGFTDEDYFRRHVKGHNFDHQSHRNRIEKLRVGKVKCPICPRYYPDMGKLVRHLRFSHPESKMVKRDPDAPPLALHHCTTCAKTFTDERRLRRHEESHTRSHHFYKCKFCGKKTVSLKNHRVHIKGHLTQKFTDEPLRCPHCPQSFVRGYGLHHHLRDEHGITETWEESGTPAAPGPPVALQCTVCDKVLASRGNYERHLDYHNGLRCNYCFRYFSSLKFLEGHLAFACDKRRLLGDTEVHPRRVKCPTCYKPFHLQVKLDCHLRTRHGVAVEREASDKEARIVCDFCFREFANEEALGLHKLYHRSVGYYGCRYCPRKFNNLTTYKKHKNHHFAQLNTEEPFKCSHCDERFVPFREMIYHMRDVHGDDTEWLVMPKKVVEERCHICHKNFYNLQRHLRLHEDNRCRKCGEYFLSRSAFDAHLCTIDSDTEPAPEDATDLRPRYEECGFCFKPYTRVSTRRKHELIHRGSGAISCRFCALKFKTIDAFNVHAFSHRSRKYRREPLRCRVCGEQFVQYGPFVKHLKGAHGIHEKMHYRSIVRPEPCVVCGEELPNLHNHYRAHLQHRCAACRKYFTSQRLFLAHSCDSPDDEPHKVFTCEADLQALINSYLPKDLDDQQKYYGQPAPAMTQQHIEYDENTLGPISIQSPIISDVLSLYQEQQNSAEHQIEIDDSPHEETNDSQPSYHKNGDIKVDDDDNDDDNVVEIRDDNSDDDICTITIDD